MAANEFYKEPKRIYILKKVKGLHDCKNCNKYNEGVNNFSRKRRQKLQTPPNACHIIKRVFIEQRSVIRKKSAMQNRRAQIPTVGQSVSSSGIEK